MPSKSKKSRRTYWGKSRAYPQFVEAIQRVRITLELGAIGIDKELEEKVKPITGKFSEVAGIRGRVPKDYRSSVRTERIDGGVFSIEMDPRSAFEFRQFLERYEKWHDELRYFLYGSLVVAAWAAFETYSATLFENLYRERPELLKSAEQLSVKDVVEHRDDVLSFLIERQLEGIGRLNLNDLLAYWDKRLNIKTPELHRKRLALYYLLRNLIAHKTGRVRPLQRAQLPAGLNVVRDEVRVSKTFLLDMLAHVETAVTHLERRVASKFYAKAP